MAVSTVGSQEGFPAPLHLAIPACHRAAPALPSPVPPSRSCSSRSSAAAGARRWRRLSTLQMWPSRCWNDSGAYGPVNSVSMLFARIHIFVTYLRAHERRPCKLGRVKRRRRCTRRQSRAVGGATQHAGAHQCEPTARLSYDFVLRASFQAAVRDSVGLVAPRTHGVTCRGPLRALRASYTICSSCARHRTDRNEVPPAVCGWPGSGGGEASGGGGGAGWQRSAAAARTSKPAQHPAGLAPCFSCSAACRSPSECTAAGGSSISVWQPWVDTESKSTARLGARSLLLRLGRRCLPRPLTVCRTPRC